MYLAISIKKPPIFALSDLSHVAKPSLFLLPNCSLLAFPGSFPFLPFPLLSSSVQPNSQSLCKKKELVLHFYSALALMCSLISETSFPGPSSEQHRGKSLTLSSVFPFSQPPQSLLEEVWISVQFPSVISE